MRWVEAHCIPGTRWCQADDGVVPGCVRGRAGDLEAVDNRDGHLRQRCTASGRGDGAGYSSGCGEGGVDPGRRAAGHWCNRRDVVRCLHIAVGELHAMPTLTDIALGRYAPSAVRSVET